METVVNPRMGDALIVAPEKHDNIKQLPIGTGGVQIQPAGPGRQYPH